MDLRRTIEMEVKPVDREINFEIGDTVRVHYRIVEGNRERVQIYEGIVIAINNSGLSKSFTVRRISYDVGVERIFPFYSTRIAKIDVVRKGKKRRSKLYFLRERRGKAAKLREDKGKMFIPATHEERVNDIAAPTETTAEAPAESKE
mgnify:CR=1 FL=1